MKIMKIKKTRYTIRRSLVLIFLKTRTNGPRIVYLNRAGDAAACGFWVPSPYSLDPKV